METSTYGPGDLIRLKSGGPVMTVTCLWYAVHDAPHIDEAVAVLPTCDIVWADYSPDGKTITRWSGHVSMVERVHHGDPTPTECPPISAPETHAKVCDADTLRAASPPLPEGTWDPTARQTLDNLRAECERLEEDLAAMTTQRDHARRQAADADKAWAVADKRMMEAEKRANTAETALGQWKTEALALRAQVADLTARLAEVMTPSRVALPVEWEQGEPVNASPLTLKVEG